MPYTPSAASAGRSPHSIRLIPDHNALFVRPDLVALHFPRHGHAQDACVVAQSLREWWAGSSCIWQLLGRLAKTNIYDHASKNQSCVNRNTILTVFLAAVLALAIVGTILIVVIPQPGDPFTELYLLSPDGTASNYQTNLTVGQTGNVTVVVVNHENANVNYYLMVKLGNATVATRSFSLTNDAKWEDSISYTPTHTGLGQKLDFFLFKDGNTTVYRSAYLYLTVT
jgi:uncharacterized membrane protein